ASQLGDLGGDDNGPSSETKEPASSPLGPQTPSGGTQASRASTEPKAAPDQPAAEPEFRRWTEDGAGGWQRNKTKAEIASEAKAKAAAEAKAKQRAEEYDDDDYYSDEDDDLEEDEVRVPDVKGLPNALRNPSGPAFKSKAIEPGFELEQKDA